MFFYEFGVSRVFTNLEMFSRYCKIELEEALKEITAIATLVGNSIYEVMPMGLINSAFTYQNRMEEILKGLPLDLAYLNDVIVHSTTMEEHVENLSTTLHLLSGYDLRLRITKRFFRQRSIQLLVPAIDENGIRTSSQNVLSVKEEPVLTDKIDVRSFIILSEYYRHFMRIFFDRFVPFS